MFATAIRRAVARAPLARATQHTRSLCEGVQVDMVCRVFTCKVKDDASAHKMDLAFEEFLDAAAEVEGCAGASRLVCKSEWDYKLILKFEDVDALTGYMSNHHDTLLKEFGPSLKALAVDGKIHEQNFVCEQPRAPTPEYPSTPPATHTAFLAPTAPIASVLLCADDDVE